MVNGATLANGRMGGGRCGGRRFYPAENAMWEVLSYLGIPLCEG